MKTVFNGIMKNKWTKLTALVIAALWSGPTVQAQAPHPERIYLSGTGIDDTRTWGVLFVQEDKTVENGKRSKYPATGNCKDSENILTVVGTL